jgi:hypothetical protein
MDLLDRVERAQRADEGPWLTPADAAGATLAERWPEDADTVLSFATAELGPDAAAHLEAALGRPVPAAAKVVRRAGRLLMRTLYAGDFTGDAAMRRVDIVMLMHRRLWAPR